MGCGDVRLLRTIGGLDVTGQERAALNKLTMPPSRLGPRISGQSPIATRCGPCAVAGTERVTRIAAARRIFFSIETILRPTSVVAFTF